MKKIYTIILLVIVSTVTNAQFTDLLDFTGTANGKNPYGSLISDGTFLYGMTYAGGVNNLGTIFKIKPDGTGYLKLLDFSGTANGSNPYGSLFYDGTFLYGMTYAGGANSDGTIFKIMPDGTGYLKLLDFSGTANGSNPRGSLISDGTFLYGMANMGGVNTIGCVFKIKPDGTGYLKLLDFASISNGQAPEGDLFYDGTFLYGTTRGGGTNNLGTIFKIKPDGTGYLKLLDFSGTANGSNPRGSLISDGTFLYGMTEQGGVNIIGTIFKIKTDGTGFVKLFDFSGAADGRYPAGSLISDGTFLYGMSNMGGSGNIGCAFKIKTDGTGYYKLVDFIGATTGSNPYGTLFSNGTSLYGMTEMGGANTDGTIFIVGINSGVIENNLEKYFHVYPNPFSETATLQITNPQIMNVELTIYNVFGQTVYNTLIHNSSFVISRGDLSNGIYFLQLKTSEGVVEKKIVIEK
jgi:uncharacterized repeat protein (TIGR03803 family)